MPKCMSHAFSSLGNYLDRRTPSPTHVGLCCLLLCAVLFENSGLGKERRLWNTSILSIPNKSHSPIPTGSDPLLPKKKKGQESRANSASWAHRIWATGVSQIIIWVLITTTLLPGSFKPFACTMLVSSPQRCIRKVLLLLPFYKTANQGTEGLSNSSSTILYEEGN